MRKNRVMDSECVFEKKKWVSLTGLCNNNCLFCLDAHRTDKNHRSKEEIEKEMDEGISKGASRLVLSGGEATIHPQLADIIMSGKNKGYTKVQVISNGRMFASPEFTKKVLEAGLDEITLSIHGADAAVHDHLTNVAGSFAQVIKGIKNIREGGKKIILNADICVNGANYRDLPKIAKFLVETLKIPEMNLLSIVPQGNAWKNGDEMLLDFSLAAPFIKETIDYCIASSAVIWISRLPPQYLEGYEEFMDNPYKMVDDVRGTSEVFRDYSTPPCKSARCEFCGIERICPTIERLTQEFSNNKNKRFEQDSAGKTILLTAENIAKLDPSIIKRSETIFEFPNPSSSQKEYRKIAPTMSKAASALASFGKGKELRTKNIPYCIYPGRIESSNARLEEKHIRRNEGEEVLLDYESLAEDLARNVKMKRLSCAACSRTDDCEGFFQNYARIHGMSEFTPIITQNNNCEGTLGGQNR